MVNDGFCTAFVQNAGIAVMGLPAKSTHLSPVENLLAVLGDRITNICNSPTTLAGLTMALQHEWHAISQATIGNVFKSMWR